MYDKFEQFPANKISKISANMVWPAAERSILGETTHVTELKWLCRVSKGKVTVKVQKWQWKYKSGSESIKVAVKV